jgi:Na+-driven multidrug efflux pump
MMIFAFTIGLRSVNFMLFIGALRAGGDTRFAMYMEIFSVWLIGVPAALIGGFVLHLPVEGVYLLVFSEEFIKLFVMMKRFLSRKWIHDLVGA